MIGALSNHVDGRGVVVGTAWPEEGIGGVGEIPGIQEGLTADTGARILLAMRATSTLSYRYYWYASFPGARGPHVSDD
jgi:hypothetical protein